MVSAGIRPGCAEDGESGHPAFVVSTMKTKKSQRVGGKMEELGALTLALSHQNGRGRKCQLVGLVQKGSFDWTVQGA